METMSFQATKQLAERIEEYRASNRPDMPNRSEVIRDALDEFLPELDDEKAAAIEEGVA